MKIIGILSKCVGGLAMSDNYEKKVVEQCCNCRKKSITKVICGLILIPVTIVAFYYLPAIIADNISYKQSQKYGLNNQEDAEDGE